MRSSGGYGAVVTFEGDESETLVLQSWDPELGQPDRKLDDGRAYVLNVAGTLDSFHAQFADLGYEEGVVSGVAWKGHRDGVARGTVESSLFVGNYFGAYTFEALDMVWRMNEFRDNVSYGFDPHDFSDNFLFEHNLAIGNGNHGIIFSRGCDNNVIRHNRSIGNAGHGIMIDDGKVVEGTDNERWVEAVPSNNNVIENNYLADNLDGVVLEGGTGNVVRGQRHRRGASIRDQTQR